MLTQLVTATRITGCSKAGISAVPQDQRRRTALPCYLWTQRGRPDPNSARLGTTMILALKNALFTVFVPGTVAGYLPYWFTRSEQLTSYPGLAALAVALFFVGIAGYAWCVLNFAAVGRGTPAPIDAPKRLVVVGLHKYVRNPMYLSVLTVIAGWAVLYQSSRVALYLAGVALMFHTVVVVYEEPALSRQFGGEYAAYRQTVRRWLPRARGRHT